MQMKSAYFEISTHMKLLGMKANFWKAFKPFLTFNCHLMYKDTRLAIYSKYITVPVVFMQDQAMIWVKVMASDRGRD